MMILAAVALAAALDASPAAPTYATPPAQMAARPTGRPMAQSTPFGLPRITEKTPNLYREPAGCRNAPYRIVDRFGRPLAQKLGDLPPGAVILAVERTIAGCQVVTVAYGQVAADRPIPPASAYRIEPLGPWAARREDAPSNRR